MSTIESMDSDVLEAHMRSLLGRERQTEVDFLLHLMEFDRRNAYRILGYTRLWDYLRKELHFLEGATWRRTRAIGILRRFPEAEGYLRDGRLCMTALVMLEEALTVENSAELFEKAARRSKREIEYLVACQRAPADGGPASIRKVPAPRAAADLKSALPPTPKSAATEESAAGMDTLAANEDAAAMNSPGRDAGGPEEATASAGPAVTNPSPAGSGRAPFTPMPVPMPARPDRIEPLSSDCFQIKMTVTKDFIDALAKAQAILSHEISRTDIAGALKAGLDLVLARDAKRKAPRAKSVSKTSARAGAVKRGTNGAAPAMRVTENGASERRGKMSAKRVHIPIEVAREVWARDAHACVWVMASGEACGSDEKTQIDHKIPVAFGGMPTVSNLRILCRGHNLLHARACFGDAHMDSFCGNGRASASGSAGRQRRPQKS